MQDQAWLAQAHGVQLNRTWERAHRDGARRAGSLRSRRMIFHCPIPGQPSISRCAENAYDNINSHDDDASAGLGVPTGGRQEAIKNINVIIAIIIIIIIIDKWWLWKLTQQHQETKVKTNNLNLTKTRRDVGQINFDLKLGIARHRGK